MQGKEDPRSGQRGNRTGRREGCVSHWKDFMRKSVKLLRRFCANTGDNSHFTAMLRTDYQGSGM